MACLAYSRERKPAAGAAVNGVGVYFLLGKFHARIFGFRRVVGISTFLFRDRRICKVDVVKIPVRGRGCYNNPYFVLN